MFFRGAAVPFPSGTLIVKLPRKADNVLSAVGVGASKLSNILAAKGSEKTAFDLPRPFLTYKRATNPVVHPGLIDINIKITQCCTSALPILPAFHRT